jgi:D-alanyl-D-alanine carboxypeptidase
MVVSNFPILIIIKNTLIFALLLIVSTTIGFGQQTNQLLDSLVKDTRLKYNIPSIAVSLITIDTVHYGIAGNRKIHGNEAVKLTAKYHLGSNTKAITSFLAFKSIERGDVNLSTRFLELFPELKGQVGPDYDTIDLGDLLSHNAGVQSYTSGIEYKKLPKFEGTATERRYAFVKYLLNQKPVKEKGTYSNAGYIVAAMMLGKAKGGTYEEALEETMKELDLDYFIGFPNKQDTLNPWGHWKEGKNLIALSPDHFYKLEDYALPAGDVSMNILDYSSFIQLHLRGLHNLNNYLLSENYERMHFSLQNYSYGWGNSNNNGSMISHHDGSAGTYYCHTVVLPAPGIAVVIMVNSAEGKHVEGIYNLRNAIIQGRKALE